jgi:hypothetical protein
MRTCDYCGKENSDAAVNCAECGTSLVASADEDNQSAEDGVRNLLRAASCFFGILSLIALVFIFVDGKENTLGLRQWVGFCSMIALFLAYGFGGNAWAARFLIFFTGQNVRRTVEKDREKSKK